MKVLGVGGYSACGKTTFANLIESRDDEVTQIHLDGILDGIKEKFFKDKIVIKMNNCGEKTVRVKGNPFGQNSQVNPIIFKCYFWIRNKLISHLVNKQIKLCKKQGYKLVIVEGVYLDDMSCGFDYIVRVISEKKERIDRWIERDGLLYDEDSLKQVDMFSDKSKRYRIRNTDDYIFNSGNLLELDRKAKETYQKVLEKRTKKTR